MSGRKASEVNGLLRNGASIRKGATDLLNSNARELESSTADYEKARKSALDQCEITIDLAAALNEFPDAANEIINAIKSAQTAIRSFASASPDTDQLLMKRKALNDSYKDADREAESIAQDVRQKQNGWYCDEEYARAGKLATRYKNLKKDAGDLSGQLSSRIAKLRVDARALSESASQIKQARTRAVDLEDKAAAAVKLREDAAAARDSVEKDFKSINMDAVRKVAQNEYDDLSKAVSSYLKSGDKVVARDFARMTSEIQQYAAMAEARYAAYLAAKRATEQGIAELEKRLSNDVFSDPLDVFRPGQNRTMTLTAFLKEFSSGKHVADIEAKMRDIQSLYDAERFQEADALIESTNNLLNEAAAHAADVHENRMKSMDNALAVQAAMVKLNYKVRLDAAGSGESDKFNGYNITCTSGDERINFENLMVGPDGKLTFDIDHKEGTPGTCGATWDKIRSELGNEGIYVEDITKNGKSVLTQSQAFQRESAPAAATGVG